MRAKVKRKIFRKVIAPKLSKSKVKAGFPQGSGDEIIMRAIYNNNGTDKIPPRPFMDNAFHDNVKEYRRIIKRTAAKIMKGETTTDAQLRKLGILMVRDIQDEIRNLRDPENAPSTAAKKGSSNPLIDTGEMRGSVTHEVL